MEALTILNNSPGCLGQQKPNKEVERLNSQKENPKPEKKHGKRSSTVDPCVYHVFTNNSGALCVAGEFLGRRGSQ